MTDQGGREEILVVIAAKRLGFKSPRRVYQLIQEGKLEAVKRSTRKTFITLNSLHAYQEEVQREFEGVGGD